MAYQNSGYKRSMKIQVIKHPDDNSGNTTIIEDGQDEFIHNGTTYTSYIGNDDGFRRLTHTLANDGTWDVRLNAFKLYIQNKYATSDPGLYKSISSLQYRTLLKTIPIYISEADPNDGGHGWFYAYANELITETLIVTVKGADGTNIVMTILANDNQYRSVSVKSTPTQSPTGQTTDLSDPTVSPSISDVAIYNVSIIFP